MGLRKLLELMLCLTASNQPPTNVLQAVAWPAFIDKRCGMHDVYIRSAKLGERVHVQPADIVPDVEADLRYGQSPDIFDQSHNLVIVFIRANFMPQRKVSGAGWYTQDSNRHP